MRHIRLLAFGLAALTAVAAVGCCHTCGSTAPEQRGYYSPTPCCGAQGGAVPVNSGLPPTGVPVAPYR